FRHAACAPSQSLLRPLVETFRMRLRRSAGAIGLTLSLLTAAVGLTTVSASAFDDALYPDLKGQWRRISPPGQPAVDPSKPRGGRPAKAARWGKGGAAEGGIKEGFGGEHPRPPGGG